MSLGPMYLRNAGDIDVFVGHVMTSTVQGERVIAYDGKRAYVSRENFDWMKTAKPHQLDAMRVMRITETASKGWLPKTPKLESFRYAP